MSLLEEKEPTISLKAIVFFVSLLTFSAFAAMFVANSAGNGSANATIQREAAPQAPETGAF